MLDSLDAARALLPAWVAWLNAPCYALLCAVATWLGLRIAIAVSRPPLEAARASAALHWTEVARFAFGVRLTILLVSAGAVAIFVVRSISFAGPLTIAQSEALSLLAFAVVVVAAQLELVRFEASVRPDCSRRQLHRSALTGALLLRPHLFICGIVLFAIPGHFGAITVLVLIVETALLFLAMKGAGIWVAARLGLVRPADERLSRLAAEVADATGVTLRQSLILDGPGYNALAFPSSQQIGVTRLALDALDDDELRAVIAHELGHLGDRRSFGAVWAAALPMLVAISAIRPIVFEWGLPAFLAVLSASLLAAIAVKRRQRRMEEHADDVSRDACDPAALASALERFYRAQLAPAVVGGKRIHPDLYDRMLASGVEPSYPRPARPPRARARLAALSGVFAALTLVLTLDLGLTHLARSQDETVLALSAALSGGDRNEMLRLGVARLEAGELSAALTLAVAESDTVVTRVDTLAFRALAEARSGHCEAALDSMWYLDEWELDRLDPVLTIGGVDVLELAILASDDCDEGGDLITP